MMLHENFWWDEDKAQKNLRKHRVSFDDAALVLADEAGDVFHVEEYDPAHSSTEDRYVTVASHPDDLRIILVIAWTDRSTDRRRLHGSSARDRRHLRRRHDMSRKSAVDKTVRKRAADIPPASRADLERLHDAMAGRVDTSDIPERPKIERLSRDAAGGLPRRSIIREAVARQMRELNITAYRLWQLARTHCPTLSQSAVHEFLKGQRQLELPSAEALLTAVHLRIVRRAQGRRKRGMKKQVAKKSVP